MNKIQLFSDIGGAAGLVLGMSASTVVGILDFLVSVTVKGLRRQIKKIRRKVVSSTKRSSLKDDKGTSDSPLIKTVEKILK